MNKETRSAIERLTQQVRKLFEQDFLSQLEGVFDVLRDGTIATKAGAHLSHGQALQREKILAALDHKIAFGMTAAEAVEDYVRDAAFTALNRFVALKMLEARELVQECISKGEDSFGYREYCGMAPGVALLPGAAGYRLYLESIFDELSTEIRALFDRHDPASVLWPRRAAFLDVVQCLNSNELSSVWGEDETIGWVYQFFNSTAERRAMREASPVPRNSRELAARNQFFTPHYIVKFLVENTLGRLWRQMQGYRTALAGCGEYVDHAVERFSSKKPLGSHNGTPKKDPRDIRLLDPACGSGHFLLYAFDVFVAIYEEAWAEGDLLASESTGQSLRADFPTVEGLRQALPGLVLRHNLYGIDIDPRCVQIAQFALWMRAQRIFAAYKIPRSNRPIIRRSNIVIAEPMPGEIDLFEEFLRELTGHRLEELIRQALRISVHEPIHVTPTMSSSLTALLRTIWSSMQLADELGYLIDVRERLTEAIRMGEREWAEQMPLFRSSEFKLSGQENNNAKASEGVMDFWAQSEAVALRALQEYASKRSGAGRLSRKLFAEDAERGFALLEVLRVQFDVVLMNPPFGEATKRGAGTFRSRWGSNLYTAFVDRAMSLGARYIGVISDRTFLTQASFATFRHALLTERPALQFIADLGWGVLDANVQVAAYVLGPSVDSPILHLDLREVKHKDQEMFQSSRWFGNSRDVFEKMPDYVLAYMLPRNVLNEVEVSDALGSRARLPRGLGSNQAKRTYMAWYEAPLPAIDVYYVWKPLANGGEFSPYYRPDLGVALWETPSGERWVDIQTSTRPYDQGFSELYFKKGLSFPKQSSVFHVSVLPAGFLPTREGKAIIADDQQFLLFLLGYLNSRVVRAFVRDTCGLHKQSGAISKIPLPAMGSAESEIAKLSESVGRIIMKSYARDETSRWFAGPTLIYNETVAARMREEGREVEQSLKRIDELVLEHYALNRNDPWLGPTLNPKQYQPTVEDVFTWALGVAFGRFDVRCVAEEDDGNPIAASIFDEVPLCPPAMLADTRGIPSHVLPSDYPIALPSNRIIVDDPGHPSDIETQMRSILQYVLGLDAEQKWNDALDRLCGGAENFRQWLRGKLFDSILSRYSKCRRKAPIYWQLGTRSGGYSVWIYAHAVSKETLYVVANDFVGPKIIHEERRLAEMIQEGGSNPSAAKRREVSNQEDLLNELRHFMDELRRVAPLWNPNLADGILISFSPLWRLVPQHKTWQKEVKAAWDDLSSGKYDWTQLAMHLWPERVLPKCATDRGLAIAHNVEKVYWLKSNDDRWTARATPTRKMDELIAECSSPAVKDALKSLIEAPVPSSAVRGRRRRVSV